MQPGDAGIQLPGHEIQRQGFHGGGRLRCPGQKFIALGLTGGQLAVNDVPGRDSQQGRDIQPAEEQHPDLVDGRGRRINVQPGPQARLAPGGERILGPGRRIQPGHFPARNRAVLLQPLEDRVELAGAHVPDPPEAGRVMEGFQQVVAVGRPGLQQAQQDVVRG